MEKLGWHSLGTAFDCPCGVRHELPIEACYIGESAAARLADFSRNRCGERVLVISDENTRHAGGDKLLSKLSKAHKKIREKVFPAAPLEATLELAEQVAALGRDADFYLVIGSGTLSDLAKHSGTEQHKPVLLYPTAASMNGYTSAIVALKIRGLKRTQPCRPATGVFCDPEVVATAPARMTAAGVGDFLSKCSSGADWRAAHLIRGDYYCPRSREFNEGIQEKLFAAAPAVGRGECGAIALALEALLLSGFGMVIAGSSAPASGGEHLISHYLDMKHALYGTPNDLHGIQVGVATVYTLGLWERVLALRPENLDARALAAARPRQKDVQEQVMAEWGPEVAREVMAQWRQKALNAAGLRAEIERFRKILPELQSALQEDLQPRAIVARCIEEARGPIQPEGMTAPVSEYHNALRGARFLRNRFTVLDLAAELGVT